MEAAATAPRISVVLLKIIAVVGTFLVAVPVALVLGGLVVQQFHAPLNAESLHVSVGVAANSAFVGDGLGECVDRGGATWECNVVDQAGSGSYDYAVTVKPDSTCWNATLVFNGGEVKPPGTLSSCVRHFDEGWWGVLMD